MIIANSVFDSIHLRPAHVYNRASIELMLATLFDSQFAVPTASIIDSKLLNDIIGPFLAAAEKYNNRFSKPLILYVDPVRHFTPDSHQHVIFDAAEAYLSGRAQTGRDVATEHPDNFPFPQNFAMIDPAEVDGSKRKDVLKALRERRESVFEKFSPYLQDNARYIERYFRRNPECVNQINNIFAETSYDKMIANRIKLYLREIEKSGMGRFDPEWSGVLRSLRARGTVTRNQLSIEGRKVTDQWDSVFQPFINFHYWNLIAKICGNVTSLNLEMGDDIDARVAEAIIAVEGSNVSQFTNQVHYTKDHDPTEPDGFKSPYRVQIDWKPVFEVRNSEVANQYHKIRADKSRTLSERERVKAEYINLISRELNQSVNFSMVQDDQGRYTITLSALGDELPMALNLFGWALPISATIGAMVSMPPPASTISTMLINSVDKLNPVKKNFQRKKWHNLIGSYTHIIT